MGLDSRDVAFVNSIRGQLIISQALGLAIKSLESSGEHESNKRDMEYLYSNVFNIFKSIEEVEKRYENTHKSTERLFRKQNKRESK